jgi:Flp pilus assembly protein TadG
MLKRFGEDRRGVAAIEFALIVPVMLLLYCGLAEVTLGIVAERRAGHAASVVADLVTQEANLTSADLTDIFTVGQAIMRPFDSASLKMRVTDVRANAAGVPQVIWSRGSGMGGLAAGPAAGFPAGLIAANESMIMTEVSYAYDSPLHIAVPTALNFSNTFYLRPRLSGEVVCATC